MPAVRADDQVGVHFDRSVGRLHDEAAYAAVRLTEPGDFGLHQQLERRVRACLGCHEVQEVPLRHQRDELAARRQVREVAEGQRLAPDAARDFANLPMRAFEKLLESTQLVQDFKRGGMDRVAAKIAQEILVLLEDDDRYAGTRQQPAHHHAGGTAARDGALDAHALSLQDRCLSTCDRNRDTLAGPTSATSSPETHYLEKCWPNESSPERTGHERIFASANDPWCAAGYRRRESSQAGGGAATCTGGDA